MEDFKKYGDYEIAQYKDKYREQVITLLKLLWGFDFDFRNWYFEWKHHENPYSNSPLGIVALYKNEVVGFRGYSPMKWKVKGREFETLSSGDTVVHQDHRLKGLSVEMGKAASNFLDYRFFMNFTAGANSIPGYIRLGFGKLLEKKYWVRRSSNDVKLTGDFSSVSLLESPNLSEVYNFILGEDNFDKITPVRTKEYLEWKTKNKKNNYLFLSYKDEGYVVFSAQPSGNNGYIVDYAVKNIEALSNILRYVIKEKPFDFTMAYNYGVCDELSRVLRDLEFKETNMNWYLLVRPVKLEFTKEDWFIEGVNSRDIQNWSMKAICSDDA